jgi:hypothetical protein
MQKALAGLAGATAVLAACGGAVAHARTGGTEATKAPMRVTVSEREFRLTLSTTKLKPGPVLFVVRNRGNFPHALEVEGTGLPEQRTRTLAPGASATLRVTLKAGKLELYCPISNHRKLGMQQELRVGRTASTSAADDKGGANGNSGGNGGGGGYDAVTPGY